MLDKCPNFGGKSLKMTPKKLEMSYFLLKSTSVWPETA